MIQGALWSWQVLTRRWVAPRRVGALTLQSGWCPQNSEEHTVTLILFYIAFMIGGDLAAYLLGLLVEYQWGKQVSLLVFLALYFVFLWVSWLLAVWVTTPSRHIKREMKAPLLATRPPPVVLPVTALPPQLFCQMRWSRG